MERGQYQDFQSGHYAEQNRPLRVKPGQHHMSPREQTTTNTESMGRAVAGFGRPDAQDVAHPPGPGAACGRPFDDSDSGIRTRGR
jgi:hypothetical protein